MVLIAVRCPDCQTDQIIKGGKTETGKGSILAVEMTMLAKQSKGGPKPALCPPLPRDRRSPAAGTAPAPVAYFDTSTTLLATAQGIHPGHVQCGPCAPERRPQHRAYRP